MVDYDVQRLLQACASGGSAAQWEAFSARFEPLLKQGVSRAFRRAGAYPRADQLDDLVQETYCKLLEDDSRVLRRCHSDSEVAIGVYLSRVAERKAIDHLRRRSAEKRGGGRVESLDALISSKGERAFSAIRPRVESRLVGKERLDLFLACCRRIAGRRKERDVRIMRLALVEGLTSREISERIGDLISPNGIDTLLHRARLRLIEEGIAVPRRRPLRAT
jgi:RNA polymerase sigma factor (sigma-70 family)